MAENILGVAEKFRMADAARNGLIFPARLNHKDQQDHRLRNPRTIPELLQTTRKYLDVEADQLIIKTLQNVLKSIEPDVKVTVGTSVFSCHKALLNTSSLYFRAAFAAPMREGNTNEFLLAEDDVISAATFHVIHAYWYTGELEVTSASLVPVLKTAHYLVVEGLVEILESHALDLLHGAQGHYMSVDTLFQLAAVQIPDLCYFRQAAVDEIAAHFRFYMTAAAATEEEEEEEEEGAYLNACAVDTYGMILQSARLSEPEHVVFAATMTWLAARHERPAHTASLLRHVHLGHVPRRALLALMRRPYCQHLGGHYDLLIDLLEAGEQAGGDDIQLKHPETFTRREQQLPLEINVNEKILVGFTRVKKKKQWIGHVWNKSSFQWIPFAFRSAKCYSNVAFTEHAGRASMFTVDGLGMLRQTDLHLTTGLLSSSERDATVPRQLNFSPRHTVHISAVGRHVFLFNGRKGVKVDLDAAAGGKHRFRFLRSAPKRHMSVLKVTRADDRHAHLYLCVTVEHKRTDYVKLYLFDVTSNSWHYLMEEYVGDSHLWNVHVFDGRSYLFVFHSRLIYTLKDNLGEAGRRGRYEMMVCTSDSREVSFKRHGDVTYVSGTATRTVHTVFRNHLIDTGVRVAEEAGVVVLPLEILQQNPGYMERQHDQQVPDGIKYITEVRHGFCRDTGIL